MPKKQESLIVVSGFSTTNSPLGPAPPRLSYSTSVSKGVAAVIDVTVQLGPIVVVQVPPKVRLVRSPSASGSPADCDFSVKVDWVHFTSPASASKRTTPAPAPCGLSEVRAPVIVSPSLRSTP